MPIVKGTTQLGNTSTPGIITVERSTGRIWEEDERDGLLRPTDGHVDIVPPGLSDELTEAKRIERAVARLTRDPNSFISAEVHKHFPEYEGIYRRSAASIATLSLSLLTRIVLWRSEGSIAQRTQARNC